MHPDFSLIFAANRDGYFARPSAVANFWHGSEVSILAGIDLQAGGTWFGVTRTGRFATVTNIRSFGQTKNQIKSRG